MYVLFRPSLKNPRLVSGGFLVLLKPMATELERVDDVNGVLFEVVRSSIAIVAGVYASD